MDTLSKERVVWAGVALQAWRAEKGERVEDESDVRDLIADLLHLLASEGRDGVAEVRMAQENFEAEVRGD